MNDVTSLRVHLDPVRVTQRHRRGKNAGAVVRLRGRCMSCTRFGVMLLAVKKKIFSFLFFFRPFFFPPLSFDVFCFLLLIYFPCTRRCSFHFFSSAFVLTMLLVLSCSLLLLLLGVISPLFELFSFLRDRADTEAHACVQHTWIQIYNIYSANTKGEHKLTVLFSKCFPNSLSLCRFDQPNLLQFPLAVFVHCARSPCRQR